MALERRAIRFSECGFEFRAGKGNTPPAIVGYPIVYNSLSSPMPMGPNRKFREKVDPQAVAKREP